LECKRLLWALANKTGAEASFEMGKGGTEGLGTEESTGLSVKKCLGKIKREQNPGSRWRMSCTETSKIRKCPGKPCLNSAPGRREQKRKRNKFTIHLWGKGGGKFDGWEKTQEKRSSPGRTSGFIQNAMMIEKRSYGSSGKRKRGGVLWAGGISKKRKAGKGGDTRGWTGRRGG